MRRSVLIAPCVLLASSAAADPPDETIIVIDKAPDPDAAPAARDRDRALGEAPFVTVVHPDEHRETASVADALGQAVGAQTRSLGGLGSFESVSVRGAAPGHTAVLIDGVPLARIAAVTTDLGRFALDSFGEVDLYRGAVPVELGGAGVGGAVNLVTRLGRGERGERWRASIGAGSFGARHLRIHYGDPYNNAYGEIRRILQRQGFVWQQGSVYFGGENINAVTCVLAAVELSRALPWFAASVRDIRMLRIEEMNDLMPAVQQATPDA